MKDGILIIDKPIGMTSHDVVSIVRKKLNYKKIGHTGTLDPFASGLMILVIGAATRLSNYFVDFDKEYVGTLELGYLTDSYDVTGKIIKETTTIISESDISRGVKHFSGREYDQTPPMYSAIKQSGKKLYEIARAGQTVKVQKRQVKIHEFIIFSNSKDFQVSFKTKVSKGTYIRSLAVDFAEYLGGLATLIQLRRVNVGPYNIENAVLLDDVSVEKIITLKELFNQVHVIVLNDYLIKLVKNGVELDQRQIETNDPFIVANDKGDWIAYYIVKEEYIYKPLLFFEVKI